VGVDASFTTVSNVATLSNLAVSAGSLVPAFASSTTSYAVTVPNATTSLTVTPTLSQALASVLVDGTSVISGHPSGAIALNPGLNVIPVAVTAQDGVTTNLYTLNVTRTTPAPTVTTLAASSTSATGATLNGTANANGTNSLPTFDFGTTTSYGSNQAAAPSPVTGSTTTAVSTVLTGLLPSTTYHFRVSASNAGGISSGLDGVFTTPSNVATLSSLVLSTGPLDQTFSPATTSYTTTVGAGTTSVTVTPTVTQAQATVKVNGTLVTSGSASAPVSLMQGANSISVQVTAQDGVTTDTYTVSVTVPSPGPMRKLAASGGATSMPNQGGTAPQLSPLPAWRMQNFRTTANSGVAADLAMPDNDGIPNLLKYGLVIPAGSSGVDLLPSAMLTAEAGDNRLALFFVRDPKRNDVTLTVEAADSPLGPWMTVATSINGAAFAGGGFVSEKDTPDGLKAVEVRDTVGAVGVVHRFMRVRVSH
jgi:hypothetical protein